MAVHVCSPEATGGLHYTPRVHGQCSKQNDAATSRRLLRRRYNKYKRCQRSNSIASGNLVYVARCIKETIGRVDNELVHSAVDYVEVA